MGGWLVLRRIATGLALGTSLLAFLAIVGTGLFLAGVEQSGERGLGVVLAVAGTAAFGAALFLAFAPARVFRGPVGKVLGAMTTVLAVLPVALLAMAAFVFVGVPYGSLVPRLDWTLFAVGLLLALGAVSIAVLGSIRTKRGAWSSAQRPVRRDDRPGTRQEEEDPEGDFYTPLASNSARAVVDTDRGSIEIDDDVRVRRA